MMLRLTEKVAEAKKLGLATMSSNPETRSNSLAIPHTCGVGQISLCLELVKLGEINPEFVPTSYKRREASPLAPYRSSHSTSYWKHLATAAAHTAEEYAQVQKRNR